MLEHAADTSHLKDFDEVEAWETAHEDWANDAQGEKTLHFDYFLNSVFELADLWTRTIDVHDYVHFLRRLVEETTKTNKRGKRVWAFRWPRNYVPPYHTNPEAAEAEVKRRADEEERVGTGRNGWNGLDG